MFGWDWSRRSLLWQLPMAAGLLVFCTAAPLLYSRDLLVVILALPYGVVLLVTSTGLLIAGILAKETIKRLALIETAAAGLTVIALMLVFYFPIDAFVHGNVVFWLWYPWHSSEVASHAKEDAIITQWDDWGFAGMSSFEVLISDPDDSIGNSADRADAWARRLKSECDVSYAYRQMRGVYILGTFNCPLLDERKAAAH